MSEVCMSVVQWVRKHMDLLLLRRNDSGRLCRDHSASIRVRSVPAILLLPALLAIPATVQAEPIVGAKFSVASGWMGVTAAFDGTNFLVPLESDTAVAKVAAQLISASGAKIGSTIALGTDGQSCCAAGVAFDGTNYLVAWEEDQGIKNDWSPFVVHGRFVNTSGGQVGQAFAMTTAGITFNSMNMLAYGGGKYLLTYTRLIDPAKGDASTNTYVAGRIVSPDGAMGNEFQISQSYGTEPSVTFDGTNFFVVWMKLTPANEVRGRFISPTGALGQEISINAGQGISDNPLVVGFDGSNYLVVWTQDYSNATGGVDQLGVGQLVSPSGALTGGVITGLGKKMIMGIAFDGSEHLVTWTDASNDTNSNRICDPGEGTCLDIYGRYVGKDGSLASSTFAINTDAGNQMGGAFCGGGKCLALISSNIILGSGGPSQVGEVQGAFVTFQAPDTSLPTVPTGLAAAAISTTQINLAWTASTDNVGVTSYKVYRNGTLVGSPAATSYSDTGLTASTSYSYMVAACDAANNCSAQSGTVAATTLTSMTSFNFSSGWNLAGNSVAAAITVATSFSDTDKVASVWKWVPSGTAAGVSYPTWAFYSPLQSDAGAAYASSKGYEFLTTINAGEGYWLNANAAFTAQLPSGTAIASTAFRGMSSGWHLIAVGNTTTPSQFNSDLSLISPAAGETPRNVISLWAWDSAQSKWYLYAPRLAAEGGTSLSNFITSNGYLNFTTAGKSLGSGIGFWVNTP